MGHPDFQGTKSIDSHEIRFKAVLNSPQTSRMAMDASLMGFNIVLPMSVGIVVLALPDHPTSSLRVQATSSLLIVVEPLPGKPGGKLEQLRRGRPKRADDLHVGGPSVLNPQAGD